jgi:hypothetical protein
MTTLTGIRSTPHSHEATPARKLGSLEESVSGNRLKENNINLTIIWLKYLALT